MLSLGSRHSISPPQGHSEFAILLKRDIEFGREWLETLLANSHCLSGSQDLCVWHYNATLSPEIMELIGQLRPMVKRVRVNG